MTLDRKYFAAGIGITAFAGCSDRSAYAGHSGPDLSTTAEVSHDDNGNLPRFPALRLPLQKYVDGLIQRDLMPRTTEPHDESFL